MVAAVQARSLTVTVNQTDWSRNLVSLEIGWDSYEQGKGLLLKKGTLTLCNIEGDSKIVDPIDQNDFTVGNIVTVSIAGIGVHPLAGKLRILAPPEVSAINNNVPEQEGNLIVSIPVGCELSYFINQEPDSDATGVKLGVSKRLDLVITDLLRASGVSYFDMISADLSDLRTYSIAFPYSKNGGGFVNLAGEFAYVGQSSAISLLYCNNQNFIRVKTIPQIPQMGIEGTITIGTDDRQYSRQLDLSLAPGQVEIDGIRRSVVDLTLDYPFTDTVEEWQTVYKNTDNGDGTQTVTTKTVAVRTFKTYFYGEAYGDRGFLDRNIIAIISNFTPSSGNADFDFVKYHQYKSHQGFEKVTFQDGEETGREYQFSFFDQADRLAFEITYVGVLAKTLYPDGWEDSVESSTKQNRINNKANSVVPSEIVLTKYSFNAGSVVSKTTTIYSNLFLIDRTATLEDDFEWAFIDYYIGGYNLGVKQIKEETWKQKKQRWAYDTQTKAPLIINNPTFVGNTEDPDGNRQVKLSLDFKATIPLSTSVLAKDTVPPGITYWGGRYELKETQLNGKQVFGNGNNLKNYKIQSPFWMSETQPDKFALIEGQIINGRQYQHLIEVDPSLFFTKQAPLPVFRVVESSKNRFFICDALTWFHTKTECYVAFAGILGGSSASGGSVITGYPSTLFPAYSGDGPLIDDGGNVVVDVSGNVVYSGTITVSGYALLHSVSGLAYDI